MKPKKSKKPQDATLRNVRAANKRFESLESQMQYLFVRYDELLYHVKILAAGIVERNVEAKKKAGKR